MADNATTERRAAWERAMRNYENMNQKLIEAPAKDRDALERAIADQEEDLLDTPAPSISAVVRKLYWLWDGQLFGIDPETEARRLILEDLETLVAETTALLN